MPNDVVCVGGGLGGLASAAGAVARGLRVLVLEAAPYVGGGGAYSGGLLWAPASAGDDLGEADAYLAHVQGERGSDVALRRSVLAAGLEAMAAGRRSGVPFEVVPGNPDVFHPHAPGSRAEGRMWEVAFDGSRLGAWRELVSPSPHYRIGLRHRELHGGELDADAVERLFEERSRADLLTMGPGLAAAYLHAAAVAGDADVRVRTRVCELLVEQGRVVGVRTETGATHRARRGVVLATGGYGWSPDAADLEGLPHFVEAGPPTIAGDHLGLAAPLGAAVVRDGGPQFSMGAQVRPDDVHPGTTTPLHSQLFDVMGMPHTLVVNRHGRRFGDESYYVGINAALARWSSDDKAWENVPCWLVVDEQFRARYPLATLPAGATYPETFTSADDLPGLAGALGIDPTALVATVAEFNRGAERGEDEVFGRGGKAFVRRRYGDPAHHPNANLGPVSRPPFHALPLRLLGTGMCTFGLSTRRARPGPAAFRRPGPRPLRHRQRRRDLGVPGLRDRLRQHPQHRHGPPGRDAPRRRRDPLMTAQLDKTVYTARAEATGGRAGHVRTEDGHVDLDLRPPVAMGGPGGAANPEALFAAGYAACFQGALGVAGRRRGVDTSGSLVAAEVSIGPVGDAFGLAVVLDVAIPGVDEATCQELADAAHEVCPYSNATRGNIPVEVRARVAG